MRSAIEAFVRRSCAARPPSHGYDHMAAVAQLAHRLNAANGMAAGAEQVHLVAMLHDVADAKYDHDGVLEQQVKEFLATVLPTEADQRQAWTAIETISFSKEKKRGMRYYEAALAPEWVAVRNTVSDADKILALGLEGLQRCRQYCNEIHHNLSELDEYRYVVSHGHDKLFSLGEDYMRTPAGRAEAARATQELMRAIIDWSLELIAKQRV